MWVKHCRECQDHYITSWGAQLPLIFCETCRFDAIAAIETIRQTQRETPSATMWHFQHVLKISSKILTGLYRAGEVQLGPQKRSRAALYRNQRPPCTVCQAQLKESEVLYCQRCAELMMKKRPAGKNPIQPPDIQKGTQSPLGNRVGGNGVPQNTSASDAKSVPERTHLIAQIKKAQSK